MEVMYNMIKSAIEIYELKSRFKLIDYFNKKYLKYKLLKYVENIKYIEFDWKYLISFNDILYQYYKSDTMAVRIDDIEYDIKSMLGITYDIVYADDPYTTTAINIDLNDKNYSIRHHSTMQHDNYSFETDKYIESRIMHCICYAIMQLCSDIIGGNINAYGLK